WQILVDEVTSARPADLVLGGLLYLLGLGFSCVFWLRLQRKVGEPLPVTPGVRAYFLSHLGKYAPVGKGWAMLVRVTLGTQAGAARPRGGRRAGPRRPHRQLRDADHHGRRRPARRRAAAVPAEFRPPPVDGPPAPRPGRRAHPAGRVQPGGGPAVGPLRPGRR